MAISMTHNSPARAFFAKPLQHVLALALMCASLGACSWMPFFGDKEQQDIEEIETTN
jgi:hypothetical protein